MTSCQNIACCMSKNEGMILSHEGGSEYRIKGRGATTRSQLALGYHVWVHGTFDWYTAPYQEYKGPGRLLQHVDLPREMVHGEGLSDADILRRVIALLDQGYLVDYWAGRTGRFEADVFVFKEGG